MRKEKVRGPVFYCGRTLQSPASSCSEPDSGESGHNRQTLRFDSRALRCALLLLFVLFVTGSECGGPPGYTVPDRSQRDINGGVQFGFNGDVRTEAKVILDDTIDGAKVSYYVPKNQPFAWIADPNKSNELTIMRPKDNTRKSTVTVAGDYTTKDGKSHHIETHIPLTNWWAN